MDSVASRYAIALLSIAREENKIKEYNAEVEQLIDLFKANPDLTRILKDYGLSSKEKKETIDLLFKGKIQEYIHNLMYVVIDNKRGSELLSIFEEFNRIALKEMNIRRGVVYSTIALTKQEMVDLEKKVSKILKAQVTLQNQLDASLFGGFKIQVEDYILDNSMKNRLNQLKETLTIKKGE